ncbi:MAG: hypothetical protein A2V88_06070 [Elusimicrobia bacterium RBG_16_66_12]|nr:MAG: hypothetical protein A2V88_06070 [Elusimicrobia bacterium RBG_16_66_12]
MKVLDLLAKEHSLFRKLLNQLELDLEHTEERARTEIDEALKTLLPALSRHEEIEDMVFKCPPDAPYDSGEPVAEAEETLRSISALREEILYALEQSEQCPFERYKALTTFLVDNLRDHLNTEETRLWPLYRDCLSRSLSHSLTNHLERRVKVLEKEIIRGMAAISMPI